LKSELAGVISKVYVPAGGKIDVGANFVEIDSEGKATVSASTAAPEQVLKIIIFFI